MGEMGRGLGTETPEQGMSYCVLRTDTRYGVLTLILIRTLYGVPELDHLDVSRGPWPPGPSQLLLLVCGHLLPASRVAD